MIMVVQYADRPSSRLKLQHYQKTISTGNWEINQDPNHKSWLRQCGQCLDPPLREWKWSTQTKHTLAACSWSERMSPGLGRSLTLIASTRHTSDLSSSPPAPVPSGKTASLWMTPSNVARYSTEMNVEPTDPIVTFTRSRTRWVNLPKRHAVSLIIIKQEAQLADQIHYHYYYYYENEYRTKVHKKLKNKNTYTMNELGLIGSHKLYHKTNVFTVD